MSLPNSIPEPADSVDIHAIIKALQGQDPDVREAAVIALGKMGPKAKDATAAVFRALSDRAWTVRFAAAEALGKMGPDGTRALITGMDDYIKWDVRVAIAKALATVDHDSTDILIAALDNPGKDYYGHIAICAARALGRIGPRASAAIPKFRFRGFEDGLRATWRVEFPPANGAAAL